MAYKYEDIATTQTGKVIYPRKKHTWKARDLGRIIDAVFLPDDPLELLEWLKAARRMLRQIGEVPQADITGMSADLSQAITVYVASNWRFAGLVDDPIYSPPAGGTFWRPFPV